MECQHCNGWPRSLQKMDSLAVPVLAEAVEVRVLEVLGARLAAAASVASLEVPAFEVSAVFEAAEAFVAAEVSRAALASERRCGIGWHPRSSRHQDLVSFRPFPQHQRMVLEANMALRSKRV